MRIAALMRLRPHVASCSHVLNQVLLRHHGELRVRGGESICAGCSLASAVNVSVGDDVLDPARRIQDCLESVSGNGRLSPALGTSHLRMALGNRAAGTIVLVKLD